MDRELETYLAEQLPSLLDCGMPATSHRVVVLRRVQLGLPAREVSAAFISVTHQTHQHELLFEATWREEHWQSAMAATSRPSRLAPLAVLATPRSHVTIGGRPHAGVNRLRLRGAGLSEDYPVTEAFCLLLRPLGEVFALRIEELDGTDSVVSVQHVPLTAPADRTS